jgi:hypothetical protein
VHIAPQRLVTSKRPTSSTHLELYQGLVDLKFCTKAICKFAAGGIPSQEIFELQHFNNQQHKFELDAVDWCRARTVTSFAYLLGKSLINLPNQRERYNQRYGKLSTNT